MPVKRLWNKDGELFWPEVGSNIEISNQGGQLTISRTRVKDSGDYTCVATADLRGPPWITKETVHYEVEVRSGRPSSQGGHHNCRHIHPAVIDRIESVSNTSVRLEWAVANFNASCHQHFKIFWWTNESSGSYDNRVVPDLKHRAATINQLKPLQAYYFQVNLVQNEDFNKITYGETRTHLMRHVDPRELSTVLPGRDHPILLTYL